MNYGCGNAPKLATVSRQRIRILILTGLVSIGGTLLLQLTWLQQAADLSEREFSDRVVTAMTEVVGRILDIAAKILSNLVFISFFFDYTRIKIICS